MSSLEIDDVSVDFKGYAIDSVSETIIAVKYWG